MLSPEHFAELMSVMERRSADEPKSEVRRAQRYPYPCRLNITKGNNTESGPEVTVQLKDISARGMGFIHNELMDRNTTFVVILESPTGDSVSILSNVVHCRQLDKFTYQVGAEFTCVLGRPSPTTHDQAIDDLVRIRASILY